MPYSFYLLCGRALCLSVDVDPNVTVDPRVAEDYRVGVDPVDRGAVSYCGYRFYILK